MSMSWPGSDLQLSLVLLAVLLVAAVWVYNKWQEYRQHRLASRIFSGEHGDALAAAIAVDTAQGDAHGQRIEPVMYVDATEEGAEGSDCGQAPAFTEPPVELADPLIDCVVPLRTRSEITLAVFWQARQQAFGGVDDDWRCLAYVHGSWRQLDAQAVGRAQHFVAALQLADRDGPLGEVALARSLLNLRQLAENVEAEIVLPAADEVLAQARQLDKFCASVDWRLSLNLIAPGVAGFDAEVLLQCMGDAELQPQADGNMRGVDALGQTQFLLSGLGGAALVLDATLAGVSLSLDVPLVSDAGVAFERLLEFSRRLVTAQQAQLVDEQRRPLRDDAIAAIRAKIAEFQDTMLAQQIPAGGRRALRLYA